MAKKLRVAADVDRSFLDRARADSRFEAVIAPALSADELARTIGDAEILVTRAHNQVDRRVIEAATRLELIAQGTSGIDNIDLAAARERGVTVVHLPGSNANAVAELVMGVLIALTRTVPLYTRDMLAGRWTRSDCATRHELRHTTLGIVGLGHVGTRVARLAAAFQMPVVAFDPYLTDADFVARGARRAPSLRELLTGAGAVTLHVPLTPETRGMVGPSEIESMQSGSVLVNMARGEVLDRSAAIAALQAGRLAGLALDVFDPEPPQESFPDHPGLILTPHIAGCSFESKAAIGDALFSRILEHFGFDRA